MKMHEWAEEINPWGCYDLEASKQDFKKDTGKPAPWSGYPASVANETVGTFKGLTAVLECPTETLVSDGWRMVNAVWEKYGEAGATENEKNQIANMNGRGSLAQACVASLKRQDI